MATFSDHNSYLLQRLLEQSLEHAFVLISPDGKIVDWSQGAEHLFGLTREQAVDQPLAAIFTPQDQDRGLADLEMLVAAHGTASHDDRWQRRADGSQFWAAGVLTPLTDEQGELLGYAKVLRDRTDLRAQIDQLCAALEAAREADSKKEVIIATLSHELRNLLAALTHVLSLLRSPRGDESRRTAMAELMQGQIDLLQRLSEDVIEAQRLKAHKVTLQLTRVAVQSVLQRVIDAAQPKVNSKRLRVDLLAPQTPIVVHADPARLNQVFVNLLDNAIKYTPPGGCVWINATIEDPEAVVHVKDNGVGVPPDMLSRIFELFTQVDASGARGGLGIGLALVRELVELHGGSVQARSEGVGKGSEFTVRLPLAASDPSD